MKAPVAVVRDFGGVKYSMYSAQLQQPVDRSVRDLQIRKQGVYEP